MNNEPVAWTDDYCLELLKLGHEATLWHKKDKHKDDIPLYTHPAKTLTDEEILDGVKDALSGWKYIRDSHDGYIYGVGWDRVQDKLEAILRKAQEK